MIVEIVLLFFITSTMIVILIMMIFITAIVICIIVIIFFVNFRVLSNRATQTVELAVDGLGLAWV